MILGVSNAPAQRMTSLLENAKTRECHSHYHVKPGGGRGFRHTLKSADTFNTDDSLAFEK
jgi:Fe-S cluster assembly iron-binding protein IscA